MVPGWRDALIGLAAIPLSLLLVGAAPTATIIPVSGDPEEALIIPADSPVSFKRFDRYGRAHFSGRFVLTGTFSYGCEFDCDGPVNESDLALDIVPDPMVAARLPHWKAHSNDIIVEIREGARLAHAIATPQQRTGLRRGNPPELRGRVAIIVDDFETGLDCDSANFSGRFVAIVKSPQIARVELNGNYGCA